MGNKGSTSRDRDSQSTLNPNERRRLTTFLQSRGSNSQFDPESMQMLWSEYLVPELLNQYTRFLMKQDVSKKNYIGVEEFVALYSKLVRGSLDEKAQTLAQVIGVRNSNSGRGVISYKTLVPYLTNVLQSHFMGLKNSNDEDYKSWTHLKHPQKEIAEQVIVGLTKELNRKGDEVEVSDLEKWLANSAVVHVLHMYVLGSLYNLEPEVSATIIPHALLPTLKTSVFLDLSQVAFINSFLPADHKEVWRFLFSTITHGESFSKFVGCITNQGPLLLVIESSDGNVFGGFISENITLGPKWVGSPESFIYSLKPSVEIYHSTGYNDHYAYLNCHQSSMPNGLGMGGQFSFWGLWVDHQFGEGECSESCTTFKNYKQLNPKKKFKISKLEAWGVGNPPLTDEEKGERTATSVLNKDPAAGHILEMSGRKLYSKGMKERDPEH